MKAIETIYNGYRFRSRLEARWAVFFDELFISYQYEPEGFELSDGTLYLPDFYLEEFDIYVEIKPMDRTIISYIGDANKWERKCANFRDSTDRAILLCFGSPAEDSLKYLFAFDTCGSGGGASEYYANFIEFRGDIILCTEPTRADRTVYTRGFRSGLLKNPRVGTPIMFAEEDDSLWEHAFDFYDPESDDMLNLAKTAARQARFEHGESPNKYKQNFFSIFDNHECNIIIRLEDDGFSIYHPQSDYKEKVFMSKEAVMILVYSLCEDRDFSDFQKWLTVKGR